VSRLLLAAAVASAALGLYDTAAAGAAPPIARPNPALVEIHVDYVNELTGPSGAPAVLARLSPAVVAQAVADQRYLAYQTASDLGGFRPAPVGQIALSSGGRNVVGRVTGKSEIPQLAQAAGGSVNSFAAVGAAPAPPPETGTQPVAGLGVPPPVTPPSNTNTVPPPNQGFGGQPQPKPTTTGETTTTTPAPTTTTTPKPKPPPTTTSTTTTTTTTPTTTAAAPPPSPPPSTPAPTGASCGAAGLTITSDHASCRLYAVNMAPGGAVSEVMTIRNDSGVPFTLSLRATGSANRLWHDLELGVWEAGTAAPAPFPALLWWTTQDNTLATLLPDESIRYELELYLPPTASNADQGLVATIDLVWRAQG
jgi:hypothetical protein